MVRRLLLLTLSLIVVLLGFSRSVSLRLMSRTPVQGTEEARSLMIDDYGLMWVGTDQGIRAFDGYRFRTYRSDAYMPGFLPNNYVMSMTADLHDGLWIGTRDGLVRYDRRHGIFKTYHLRGEQSRAIDALFTSADGTIWAGTAGGVSRYDAEKDDFIDINMTAGVRSFAEDKQGHIYIGTWEEGIYRLDRQSGQLVGYPRLCRRNTAQSMLVDSRGRLWIGTWEDGIVRMDHPGNEKEPGIRQVNDGRQDFRTFRGLVEDPVSHAVWGCCIEGLTRVDLDDMSVVDNHPVLSFCYDMKTDGQGNLWVLTRNQGIVHLSTKPSPFSSHHLDPAGLVLPVNRIQSVFTADGNRFWLSLQPYGLALYDRRTGEVRYNNQIPGFSRMTGNGGIHVQTILAMMELGNHEVGMAGSDAIIVWKEGEEARQMPRYGVPFLTDGRINAFYPLRDGSVLIGQSMGVGLAMSATKGHLLKMTENGRDFSTCDVHAIIEDSQHRFWVATENAGIIRITGDVRRPESLGYHQYVSSLGNYPIDEATDCYEDTDHRLWAISSSGGLFLYDEQKDAFEIVNHRFHILVNSIYSIEGDIKGHIWLSTDKGLVCLKINAEGDGVAAYYGMEDGIENLRFSQNGLSSFGSEIFFGSADGFVSFEPDQVVRWQQRAPASLIVSQLFVDDLPYDRLDSTVRSSISDCQPFFTREITIPSDMKKFSVEFSLLTYQNPEQCKYAYQLKGYDRDWHYTDAESRRATYQNLPPGSYELCLRAIDSYGHCVSLPYTIDVRVLPPWYRSWWAYLIYILLLAAAVYGIKEWYKQRVNRRARLQQRVSELLHYREMMVIRQFEGAHKALEAEEQQHSSPDELFLQKAIDCVKQHLDDADYDREQFASDMCVSSSTLYNKLRALTGQTVTGFINSIRLKEACSILRQRPDIKMSELSMAVGFNTPKYFAKLFKKEFGVLPSEYVEQV